MKVVGNQKDGYKVISSFEPPKTEKPKTEKPEGKKGDNK